MPKTLGPTFLLYQASLRWFHSIHAFVLACYFMSDTRMVIYMMLANHLASSLWIEF